MTTGKNTEPIPIPIQLEAVLTDMQRSIEAKLYYPALLIALTIPEICSALELERQCFVKQRHYINFIDSYTTERGLGLDGVSCFRLRGGVVHRANFRGHPHFNSTHVIFTIPESNALLHGFSIKAGDKRSTHLDLITFCSEMDAAARKWFYDHLDNEYVFDNLKELIRYCPDGVEPFLKGPPVIASGE